jgi:ATP-dependent Lon protease
MTNINNSYPILPLRDIVVFPHMIVPLFVGREKSVRALEEVMQDDKDIVLASQVDPNEDEPKKEGIYKVGVIANVLQLLKLPDGTVKVLVEGRERVKIKDFIDNPNYFEAEAEILAEQKGEEVATEALSRSVVEEFEKYAKLRKNVPEEVLSTVAETKGPSKLADIVSGHLGLDISEKQGLLETLNVTDRLEKAFTHMKGELSVLKVEKKNKNKSKNSNGKNSKRVLSK